MSALRFFLVITLLLALPIGARAVDIVEVERLLTTTGLEGEIHGAAAGQGLFVLTYRNPKDFFDFVLMSLVTDDPEVEKLMRGLSRHDRVRIKGRFLPNPSPQKHIMASSLEVVKRYAAGMDIPPYSYDTGVPKELLKKSSARFLVHAIEGGGGILVVEYKDTVLPIFVRNPALTKDLSRNDVIEAAFQIQNTPNRPIHLSLNENDRQPLRVIDSIKAKHGTSARLEGTLVLFPKSPQIAFNVFAVLEKLPGGLTRQYTLLNQDNPDVFNRIRAKLQTAWDSHAAPGDYINGRNKLVSKRVRVKVTGTFSQTDSNQANPQILLSSEESIRIRP